MGKVTTPKRSLTRSPDRPTDGLKQGAGADSMSEENESKPPVTVDQLLGFKDEILACFASHKNSKKEYGSILLSNVIFSNKKRLESYLEGEHCLAGKSPSSSSLDVLSVFGEMTRSLCPLLVDDDPGVRAASAEALSHVSSMSQSIADHLVSLDVMTSIEAAISKLAESCDDKDMQTFCNVCDSLNNLCSRSQRAISDFASTSIPSKLISVISQPIDRKVSRHSSAIQVLLTTMEGTESIPGTTDRSLLAVLVRIISSGMKETDNDSGITDMMSEGEAEKKRQYRLQEERNERVALTASASLLLLNLVNQENSFKMSDQELNSLHRLILSNAKVVLEKEVSGPFNELIRILKETDEQMALVMNKNRNETATPPLESTTDPGPSFNDFDEFNSKSSALRHLIQGKNLVVEYLVKLIQSEADDEGEEETGEGEDLEIQEDVVSEPEDDTEDEIKVNVNLQTPKKSRARLLSDRSQAVQLEMIGDEVMTEADPELPRLFKEYEVIEKMVSLLDDPVEESLEESFKVRSAILRKLSSGEACLDEWKDLRANTLIALSSISQTSPHILMDGQELLQEKLIEMLSREEDYDILRSIAEAIRSLVEAQLMTLSPENVKAFADIIKRSGVSPESDKPSVISCIKILGSVASQSSDQTVVASISSLLLQVLEEDVELHQQQVDNLHDRLLIFAEILDTIMDIFSEDVITDQTVVKIQLLPRISQLDKTFCHLVKQLQCQRKEKKGNIKKQDFAVIQTVAENVKRFIRYKTKMLGKTSKK